MVVLSLLFVEQPSTKEPDGSEVLRLRWIPIWTDEISQLTQRIGPSDELDRLSRVQPTIQGQPSNTSAKCIMWRKASFVAQRI